MFEFFCSDKVNREFLSMHEGKQITITGKCIKLGRNGSCLVDECTFSDDGVTIALGHMWWQRCLTTDIKLPDMPFLIQATGYIESYMSKGKKSYGFNNYAINKVTPMIVKTDIPYK